MLVELTVRDLGVIEDLTLLIGRGMTALTGETGAGKTLVVEAIELLVGGRPDPVMVRPGAEEAWVEGRFAAADGGEVVLARAVPAVGRSRAYVDGRMVPVGALAEHGARLVDLHGQHAHQSLLAPAVQRAALDAFGRIDRRPLDAARARLRAADEALRALGGDARARAREVDLLRFQVAELDAADLEGPDEELELEATEALLAQAGAWREAAAAGYEALQGDGGAGEVLGAALSLLRGRGSGAGGPRGGTWKVGAQIGGGPIGGPGGAPKGSGPSGAPRGGGPSGAPMGGGPTSGSPTSDGPIAAFAVIEARLANAAAEVADAAADLRMAGEAISDDPQRLAEVQQRRHLLRDLRRKYGDTLADVLSFADEARTRLAELESYEQRAATIDTERSEAATAVARAATAVAAGRRAAAPELGAAVESHLRALALGRARFSVEVGGAPPADEVTFGFGANAGEAVLPLAKVASGGELARVMLATRLVLTAGPPTLVFDEVDAGIGGEAAIAVGAALARLGREPWRQVLVVTHLPQVAAFADAQIAVAKAEAGDRTVAHASGVTGEARVRELSRMLSGRPESDSARQHAAELLAAADLERRDRG